MDIRQLTAISHWKVFATLAGAVAGYAYYYYIGCVSGACPITSNPWISTAYGALIGWLAAPGKRKTDIAETTMKEKQ